MPLTDGEFAQVMGQVQNISDSYEAAKILAMENSMGKIAGIFRGIFIIVKRETG